MKKLMMLVMAGMFVFGCTKPAPPTTPTATGETRGKMDSPPPPPADQPAEDSTKNKPKPASTGYGTDPGEETQE